MSKKFGPVELHELRLKRGMSQRDFWGAVGISQSMGSCYERDTPMTLPVEILVELVHVKGVSTTHLNKEGILVAQHLQETDPAYYASVLKLARSKS